DGTQMVAAVVGSDARSNIAILKIQTKVLINERRFVDPYLARRAQPGFLIGNPYGLEGSVFVGLISAKGRPANSDNPYEYFQIDASVSPGIPGGAVFDFDGNVIGMMQLIHTPANDAMPI